MQAFCSEIGDSGSMQQAHEREESVSRAGVLGMIVGGDELLDVQLFISYVKVSTYIRNTIPF